MSYISIFLIILVIGYGGLTILAGSVQLKEKQINLMQCLIMILGGSIIIISIIFSYILMYHLSVLLIAGLVIIHLGATSNGFKIHGKLNLKHHIIRFIFSALIIGLYFKDF